MSGTLDARRGEAEPHGQPRRRVVLLGASNLTKAIGPLVGAAKSAWSEPVDVLVALGHGRSFGTSSRVLGRRLPGIAECGLWRDLAAGGPGKTAALVTDIGNDLMYEQPVERIAGWVETCLDRLAEVGADTVVTLLPVDNLPKLSPARFLFFRTLFVPTCRAGLEEMVARAYEVDRHVERLARERGFAVVRQKAEWYGLDPIHIRLFKRSGAWSEILGHWPDCEALRVPSSTPLQTLYLRTRTPEWRSLLGFEQRGRKPSALLADGSSVTIY